MPLGFLEARSPARIRSAEMWSGFGSVPAFKLSIAARLCRRKQQYYFATENQGLTHGRGTKGRSNREHLIIDPISQG